MRSSFHRLDLGIPWQGVAGPVGERRVDVRLVVHVTRWGFERRVRTQAQYDRAPVPTAPFPRTDEDASSGVAVLMETRQVLEARGHTMLLVNVTGGLLRVLAGLGLMDLLSFERMNGDGASSSASAPLS
jgi:hypothetical protein